MIIGQDKLLNQIKEYNLDTFPRSTMLIGKYGSGKHLVSNYISEHLQLPLSDISDKINLDTLTSIQLSTNPSIYVIDTQNITEKEQDTLLKFLEEPLKNSYIILLVSNVNRLFPTIQNRCFKLYMATYTKEILSSFIEEDTNKELILDIAETPGEVVRIKGNQLVSIIDLCNNVIDNMKKATYDNALKIIDKLNYRVRKNAAIDKNEAEKLDLFLFVRALLKTLNQRIKNENNVWYYKAYDLTLNVKKKLDDSLVFTGWDQKPIFAQYIVNMWKASRGQNG